MTDKFAPTTFRGWLNGALRLLAVLGVLAASLLPPPSIPTSWGGRKGGLLPLRTAQASGGSWTQTEWITPTTTLTTAPSGTALFFRPASLPTFGQLIGSFNVCAGPGAWCQGPGDSAPGQTVRLAGNHKGDAGNFYSSDLNGDGISELLVANINGPNGGWIYWGQGAPTSPSWSQSARTDLSGSAFHSIMSSDLNGDGLPELIHTNSSGWEGSASVYWGQAGGPHGVQYSASARTVLATHHPLAATVADLNHDGRPELIIATYSSTCCWTAPSFIYWGLVNSTYGVGYSDSHRTDLTTSGGTGVAVADLNGDGLLEIIFANSIENANSVIYWAQPGGTYGVTYSSSTLLPTNNNAQDVTVADLNSDGRPEVIFASHSQSFIYWGQTGGIHGVTYNTTVRTNLPAPVPSRVAVANLNGDNHPDVVIQGTSGGPISNGSYTRVFWGPLPVGGTAVVSWTVGQEFTNFRGMSLSDLDSDGRPDLFVTRDIGNSSTGARVYFHGGDNAAPYGVLPALDLPVNRARVGYTSFGVTSGIDSDRSSQPRPVRGTATTVFGAVESMVIDSGQNGTVWHTVFATTSITAGTGITLFMAASNNISALTSPGWVQVGAMSNGSWTQTVSGVSGRYARYRAVLWRSRTTEASPALQQITLNYGTLPGSFNKNTPSNGTSGVSTGPTLSWTTAADATHYEVCHDTTINGACNGTWQNVGNALNTTLSGLTLGTTYEWQVRACNIGGCNGGADGGTWWTFTTVTGPAPFSKSSPSNGALSQPLNPTLVWDSTTGQGTVTYSYCIKTVNAACTGSEWLPATGTSVTVSGLNPGTVYYWQARACDANGCTQANGGNLWNFQTAQAVASFNKLSPGDAAINVNTNTMHLQWAGSAGATEYKVCLGTAVNNCNILGDGPGQYASVGTNLTRTLSDLSLLPNTTYYWQALATNGVFTTFANGGALSFWSFTTLPSGLGSFNKQAPVFNATNVPTSNVSFSWTPASGAVSYTVCVGAFAGDCSYSVTSTTTSAVLPGPLPAGATLVWQVTAHNTAGTNNADSNAWWPLTIAPNAPASFTKYVPVNGAAGQPVGVNLSWQDIPDETHYQVCVGTSPGVCTFVNVTVTANTTNYALAGLDYGTTYWWQVSACNAGGCTPANNGVTWSFTTQNPPLPGAFQKTAPGNGALNVPTNTALVLLQWTTSAQADGYEVCLGTYPGACDLSGGGFQDVGNFLGRYISQLPFSVTLAPATTYYWQARSYNNMTATRTLADGGVDFYFTTVAVSGPGAFSKDAPLNGSSNLPTATLVLRWLAAAGATSYEVCVGTVANSCDALPGNTWLNVGSALTYTLTNLQPGTTYWWQARAINSGGTTVANGGQWWSFTMRNANPPAEFSKSIPAPWATNVPTATAVLSWFVSTGATAYEVCVGSAPGLCEASGGWVNVGNVTQWTLPALSTATTYWWQARALGNALPVQANGGTWWSFTTVSSPPLAFSKQTAAQGASGQPTSGLQLTWATAAGATSYEVCVGTQAGLCDVSGSWVSAGNATNWTVNTTLQPATTYWWQVRAVNAGGQAQANNGQWWYFITAAPAMAPGTFNKVAPANNAISQPLSLLLSWNAAAGATGYQVCAGALPGDCSKTGGWASVAGTSYALSGLNYATTYWWQVRAVNAGGQVMADSGVWWQFTTENAPGSPIEAFAKAAPAHTATGVPTNTTLSWGAAANAVRYTVCVGTQPGLCDVMNHVEVFSPTASLTLANAQPGQTYWWQVFAYNDGNLQLADAGQWWAFSTANDTATGPGDFGKTSPISGTTVANPVGLAWGASSGAVGYRVCVGTAWGLCDAVNQVATTGSSLTITLPAGSYWWQVTAVDAESDTTPADGGEWWPFTVQSAIGNVDTSGPLGTRKEVSPTVVRMGELVSYTIVLSNSESAAATVRVTDTLAVSATLVGATPGYSQTGQTLAWSNVVVPAGGTTMLTITVRAASGPLPGSYLLGNSVTIGAADGEIVRDAPAVTVEPRRIFAPVVRRP